LSNVSRRFQRKEILESVVYPSLVISDQFAAKSVVTVDGKTYTGLVGETGDGVVVLQTTGEKINLAKADIEQIVPSRKSAMPEGLFNTLSAAEIADLFAYLANPPANP
jgi:putative heme-binding domain-containing protein